VPETLRTNCDNILPSDVRTSHKRIATLFSYRLLPHGEIRDVALYKSSGNSTLDSAVLGCFAKHLPPMTVDGKPVEIAWIGGFFWWPEKISRYIRPFLGFSEPSPDGSPNLCPEYPPFAVRRHEQGTVSTSFHIATDGSVKDLSITKSSGYTDLDDWTLSCLQAFRYFPVKKDGVPVQIDKAITMNWRLN